MKKILLYKHYGQIMLCYFISYANFQTYNKMSPKKLDAVFYVSVYKVSMQTLT